MTVIDVQTDFEALTFAIVSDLAASVDRAWQLWADPRQLERWWGPPTYPATFVEHDLSPGAVVTYFMTSPEGEKYHGWWRVVSVDAPHAIELIDGFGDPHDPPADLPTGTMRVTLAEADAGSRMTITSTFESTEAMEKLLEMGQVEGMSAALGQIDDILANG